MTYQFQSVLLYISKAVDHIEILIMISPGFFFFFKSNIVNIRIFFFIVPLQQFFYTYLFFKFINKCQKEILRCTPPSSHVCDFYKKNYKKLSVSSVFLSVYSVFSHEELFHSDTKNWFFILKALWKSVGSRQFHLIIFCFCEINV